MCSIRGGASSTVKLEGLKGENRELQENHNKLVKNLETTVHDCSTKCNKLLKVFQ